MKLIALAAVVVGMLGINASASEDVSDKYKKGFKSIDEAIEKSGIKNRLSEENSMVALSASENQDELRREFGSTFAGTWIDYDENNNAYQVLALTQQSSVASHLENSKFVVVYVRHSFDELVRVHESIQYKYIGDRYKKTSIKNSSIDIKENVVVVMGFKEDLDIVRDELKADGYDLSMIRVEVGGVSKTTADLYNGSPIITTSPTAAGVCTSGFNAIADGYLGVIITAAHCANDLPGAATAAYMNLGWTSNPVYGPWIGSFIGDEYSNGGMMDAIMYGNAAGHNLYPHIKISSTNMPKVNGVTGLVVGGYICTMGTTTGWRCGTVSTPPILNIYPSTGRKSNLNRVSGMCSEGGDSGGPVVSAYTILAGGILSGVFDSSSGCGEIIGGTTPTSLVQPLTPYLQKYMNVQMKTN